MFRWRILRNKENDRLEQIRLDLVKRIDELRTALRISLERQVEGLQDIRDLNTRHAEGLIKIQSLLERIEWMDQQLAKIMNTMNNQSNHGSRAK